MNQTFQEFLAGQSVDIPIWGFVLNMLIATLLSVILRGMYVRFGRTLSNRKSFASNLILITVTTLLIITVVKSSLALSLGLVGALSIVRFRTAIKEPEELAYLFLSIAIGLGLGADQRAVTLIGFVLIAGIIAVVKKSSTRTENSQNLYLTVASQHPEESDIEDIVKILKNYCTGVSLRRFDDSKELLEATFQVEFEGFPQLAATKTELHKLGDAVRVTFLDNKVIGG